MKKIYYWSPHLSDDIATIKSVKNSACSLKDYSNNYSVFILDAVGEWSIYKDFFEKKKINIISLGKNIYKSLPRGSFVRSRISYIIIFFLSFFNLVKILKKDKPDYLIIHLVTSLPLFIFLIFGLRTKLILRISGMPKLNILRNFFWRIVNNKINFIICPSEATYNHLIKKKIFEKEKIFLIYDPIINIKEFRYLRSQNIEDDKFYLNNIVLAGRFTKQKNFIFFIKVFKEITKTNPLIMATIIGKGEQEKEIKQKIKDLKLTDRIYIADYKKNLFNYFLNSKFFILTSLWEDPGFVLIEAAMCNLILISSDCPNGPSEFLNFGKAGFLFKSNSASDLNLKILEALNADKNTIKTMKFLAKKNCLKYTKFKHFNKLRLLLN